MAIETVDELQEMIPSPPTQRKVKRWPWVGVSIIALCLLAVGTSQAKDYGSPLKHVSMVHKSINSIMAATAKDGVFTAKVEFLYDAYQHQGAPPSAMGIYAKMEDGGEGKIPKVIATISSAPRKANALKAKVDHLVDLLVKMTTDEDEKNKMKEAIKIQTKGDAVSIEITAPEGDMEKDEDADLKAAFKAHKPVFTGNVTFARTFEDMAERKTLHLAAVPEGIEVMADATVANIIFETIKELSGMAPQIAGVMKVLRYSRDRSEMYYTSQEDLEEATAELLPTLEQELEIMCNHLPGDIATALQGIDTEATGMDKIVLEGLPYDWEVVVTFKKFNPFPLTHCG